MEETKKSREIDVLKLLKDILSEKKLLFKFVFVSAIIGVIVALSLQKEYTSQVVLAPELTSGGLGMSGTLSDMASSFGIDLGAMNGGVDAIYPEIYPDVLASSDFIITLFDVPVKLKKGKETTYYKHIREDSKPAFWEYPKIWISEALKKKEKPKKPGEGVNRFQLTKDEDGVYGLVRKSIHCLVDKKTSVITVSLTDHDPLVAAIMVDTIQTRLQRYIIDYRTKKARNDFEYYKQLYDESREQYKKAQQLYASFSDANQDVVLASYKAKLDDLENDMQLKYNIYNQMSAQMQSAKAKIQERTPAFTAIQGASVPLRASSTPRSLIVLLFMFLGCVADGLWLLYGRDWFANKKKSKQKATDQ